MHNIKLKPSYCSLYIQYSRETQESTCVMQLHVDDKSYASVYRLIALRQFLK